MGGDDTDNVGACLLMAAVVAACLLTLWMVSLGHSSSGGGPIEWR